MHLNFNRPALARGISKRIILAGIALFLVGLPACQNKKSEPIIPLEAVKYPLETLKLGCELRAVIITEMQEDASSPLKERFLQTDSDGRLTRMGSLEQLEHLIKVKDQNIIKMTEIR